MKQIIKFLYNCKGVVNVSNKDEFEVQPGIFSSVYVNFKSTLSDPKTRQSISRLIADNIGKSCECICGIESGGSYYASSVADLLDKKIILFRKIKKRYNIKNRFAGTIPAPGHHVVVIDDVMSSGNTVAKAVNFLKKNGCEVRVMVVFSYCWEKKIAQNLGTTVTALSDAQELIEYGLLYKKMSLKNVNLIKGYIKREENRVYRKGSEIR